MSQYRKILVGLDLSEDSSKILTQAKSMAKSQNAELNVVHIIEPLSFAYGGDIPVDLSEAQKLMESHADNRLKKLCEECDIPVENSQVCIGHTSHTIHEIAEEMEADLIIVGSHGRHGLALLLGSTANGVIKGAPCDVLAMRI